MPEGEGTPTTVLTLENGMTLYAFREGHDWEAASRLAHWLGKMMHENDDLQFVEIPGSQMAAIFGQIIMPVDTIRKLQNIHDALSSSPLAKQKSPPSFRRHGPGKRTKK